MQLDYFIENKASREDVLDAVHKWLSEGEYTPDDILSKVEGEPFLNTVPIYFYSKEYTGSCTATLGFTSQASTTGWDNVNKRQIQQTTTVRQFQPYAKYLTGRLYTLVHAGEPFDEPVQKIVERTYWKPEDLQKVPYIDAKFDQLGRLFKFSDDELWQKTGYYKMYNHIRKEAYADLPNAQVKDFDVTVSFTDVETFSVTVPIWCFLYSYGDKNYYVIVDGHDLNRIDGSRPVSREQQKKVKSIQLSGWILGILVSLLAGFLVYKINSKLAWLGFLLPVAGLFITHSVINKSIRDLKERSKKAREDMYFGNSNTPV